MKASLCAILLLASLPLVPTGQASCLTIFNGDPGSPLGHSGTTICIDQNGCKSTTTFSVSVDLVTHVVSAAAFLVDTCDSPFVVAEHDSSRDGETLTAADASSDAISVADQAYVSDDGSVWAEDNGETELQRDGDNPDTCVAGCG